MPCLWFQVLGKTVVVVGQGQNGLIATRLMSQFAAKEVQSSPPPRERERETDQIISAEAPAACFHIIRNLETMHD